MSQTSANGSVLPATRTMAGPAWQTLRPWHTNAALLVLGFGLLYMSKQLAVEFDGFHLGYAVLSSLSVLLWLSAALILHLFPDNTNRYTLPIILGVAVLCRLAVLFQDPSLSTDVYRYAWDGIVQHAGINPYRYVPADPHLQDLQQTFSDVYNSINRKDYARTIYPPVAQMLFFCITWVSPTLTGMKMGMVLFEGMTVTGLLLLCRRLGLRRERILLYAWCPMLIWEIGSSGHIDSMVMAFLVFALLFRLKPPTRRNLALTGLFLGCAFLIKFYPIVLFPALWRRRPTAGRPDGVLDWTMPAVLVAMTGMAYAVYSSVGKLVLGFLPGYSKEEGMDSGSRFFLLDAAQHLPGLHHLPNAAFYAFALLVLAGLGLWGFSATRASSAPAAFLPPAFATAAATMLLFCPHYPWYIAWLVPFSVLMPTLPILTYVGLFFYLCTTAIAVGYGPQQYLLNEILYAWVAGAAIIEVILRRIPVLRRWFPPVPILAASAR